MANITVTEAADVIPEIWAASALGRLKSYTTMARLVNRDWSDQYFNQGDILHIPKRGALVVNNKSANTARTLQTPSTSKVDVTLNRHKDVSFLVEDPVKAMQNQEIMMGYLDDGVVALADELDTYLLTFATGFSQTVGAAATPATADLLVDARKKLTDGKVPKSDLQNVNIVLGTSDIAALLKIEKLTSAQHTGEYPPALVSGYLASRYGFNIYESQNVGTSGSPVTKDNLAFHRDAIVLAMRSLPLIPQSYGVLSTVVNDDGFGVRQQISYDHMQGGVIVSLDVLYGAAELRDEFGVWVKT